MSKYKIGDKLYEYYGVDKDSGKLSREVITIIQVLEKISETQYYLTTTDISSGYSKDYSTHKEGAFKYMASSEVDAIKNYLSQPHVFLCKAEYNALLEFLPEDSEKELVQYLKEIRIEELEKEIDFKEEDQVKTKKLIEELRQELRTLKEGKG